MNKALFLDLDNTIIQTKSGETFPVDAKDWKFRRGILQKIEDYYCDGYKICIITNQAGINEGYVKPSDFKNKILEIRQNICDYINEAFNIPPIKILLKIEPEQIVVMAAKSKEGGYYKPSPKSAKDISICFKIDLLSSIMVGDASGIDKPGRKDFSDSDRKFAENAGIGRYIDVEEFLETSF